jgi:hypothetical protein
VVFGLRQVLRQQEEEEGQIRSAVAARIARGEEHAVRVTKASLARPCRLHTGY